MNRRLPVKKLAHLFLIFFRVGAFTIGGDCVMSPIIQDEMVNNHGWMANEEFLDSIALTNSVPDPLTTNTAIFVGYCIMDSKGALTATLGVISPSILIILLIASAFERFADSPITQALFEGIRPVMVALIPCSVFKLGKSVRLREKYNWLLVVLTLLAISVLDVHPISAIVAGALPGISVREKL